MSTGPRVGIRFPPVKEKEAVLREQAALPPGAIRDGLETEMPPVIRSVLELSHLMMSGHSQWLRAAPGYQGGLFHMGRPYCFASGYRDNQRLREVEERGNHLKLKDPLVYGKLTLPITAAFLCELHGKGIMDLTRPLVSYLPEMEGKMAEHVTARSVLSFTDALDDSLLVKDITGSRFAGWRPVCAWNACAAAQKSLFEPIQAFLSHSTTTSSSGVCSGAQQRQHLYYYLSASRSPAALFRRVAPHKARISHFSIAVLLHAAERQLEAAAASVGTTASSSTFEEAIRQMFFERSESHGAGFGAPKLWRNPQELFYQPTGLALQHSGFQRPLAAGSVANSAPAVFNGSLNLYAPCEDYGKLLLLSLDTIREAREALPLPSTASGEGKRPHYDFGIRVVPAKDELQLLPSRVSPRHLDWLPSAASFRYKTDVDLGCFGIASCGSRAARLFAFNLSRLIQHLYVKHALRTPEAGAPIDPNAPPLPNETAEGEPRPGTPNKLQDVLADHHRSRYFRKLDHHKRF